MPATRNNVKIILTIVALALLIGGVLWGMEKRASYLAERKPMEVEVIQTPEVAGVLAAPEGLPQDMPLEEGRLVESTITNFPAQNAVQTSVTYRSEESQEEKYEEYRVYMEARGYDLTEGDAASPVRTLFGTKDGEDLSITLSTWEGLTVVQIAHLSYAN